jgi:hypothetical protein
VPKLAIVKGAEISGGDPKLQLKCSVMRRRPRFAN